MTPAGRPAREPVTAEVVVHAVAGSAVVAAAAAHVASGGDFPADRAMAVVLAGLAASGLALYLGGPRTDDPFESHDPLRRS